MNGATVYAIGAANAVKIGMTNDIDRRLRRLQTGNPHKLSLLGWVNKEMGRDDALEEEARLHQSLSHARMHGEWFHWNPAISALRDTDGFRWTSSWTRATETRDRFRDARAHLDGREALLLWDYDHGDVLVRRLGFGSKAEARRFRMSGGAAYIDRRRDYLDDWSREELEDAAQAMMWCRDFITLRLRYGCDEWALYREMMKVHQFASVMPPDTLEPESDHQDGMDQAEPLYGFTSAVAEQVLRNGKPVTVRPYSYSDYSSRVELKFSRHLTGEDSTRRMAHAFTDELTDD